MLALPPPCFNALEHSKNQAVFYVTSDLPHEPPQDFPLPQLDAMFATENIMGQS